MRCSVLMEKPEMAVDQKRKKSRGKRAKKKGNLGDSWGLRAWGFSHQGFGSM